MRHQSKFHLAWSKNSWWKWLPVHQLMTTMGYSYSGFSLQMLPILCVCSNLLREPAVGWGESSASGCVRLCQVVLDCVRLCYVTLQSRAVACETFWHFVMRGFTYGCTWWWCAGSWGAAACTRGSSSRGRQTWTLGWFSPCTLSPGAGRISPCCPVRKGKCCDLLVGTEELLGEVKLLNHGRSLSWHILTLQLRNAMLQLTIMCLQWHAEMINNQERNGHQRGFMVQQDM